MAEQKTSRQSKRVTAVRAKVQHCFYIIKRLFGFSHVRYLGVAKNLNRLQVTCALANLFSARKHLLRATT